MRRCASLGLAILMATMALPAPVLADGFFTVREWGIQAGGGNSLRSGVQNYPIQPYVGFAMWKPIDDWFDGFNADTLWMIEPWVAFISDQKGDSSDSFEIGVSPVFFRLTYGDAAFRPFIEGGLGLVYTDLRSLIRQKSDLGQRMQFSTQGGGGVQYTLSPDMAISLSARFRHISNAGLSDSNPGIDTIYGLLGIIFR
jgi:opacity protein-like surface antigen